jgi:hypothetical protein
MLLVPLACNLLLTIGAPAAELSPASIATLHASFDPSLGALRAGRVEAPASFSAQERSELAAAQQRSPTLDALRAGFEPTDNEWKWFAIGGAIILLIILL